MHVCYPGGVGTPSVPPPHHYFPAHLSLFADEADQAAAKLLSVARDHGAAAFLEAWGMALTDGKLCFLKAPDPLRQV